MVELFPLATNASTDDESGGIWFGEKNPITASLPITKYVVSFEALSSLMGLFCW
jgi:hypothetical protein